MTKLGENVSVFAVAAFVIVAIAASAFGVGYLIGKLLL